ncbi:MAG: hypothetical protein R3C39_02975 [Dehalococcoidia bacterium]
MASAVGAPLAVGLAATGALALLGVLVAFQLALALGARWGAAAWGGQHRGTLPTSLRVASAVAAIAAYPIVALYIVDGAGIARIGGLPGRGEIAMWVLGALLLVGGLANFASRSRIERIWGPVSLGLAACCAVIAVGQE